jgi:hypothetical protein
VLLDEKGHRYTLTREELEKKRDAQLEELKSKNSNSSNLTKVRNAERKVSAPLGYSDIDGSGDELEQRSEVQKLLLEKTDLQAQIAELRLLLKNLQF